MFTYPQIDMKKTGANIRRLCKEKDCTVRELQELLHIGSNQAIYNWFNGKALPSPDNLVALAELLDTPIDNLLIINRGR